jgi:hypothetical protein
VTTELAQAVGWDAAHDVIDDGVAQARERLEKLSGSRS